jgi:hypothetical protein
VVPSAFATCANTGCCAREFSQASAKFFSFYFPLQFGVVAHVFAFSIKSRSISQRHITLFFFLLLFFCCILTRVPIRSATKMSAGSSPPPTKLWWSPVELKSILDQDAEDIRRLRETVDVLLNENVELRREIAILKTPSDAYYMAYSGSLGTDASNPSRSAAESSIHQLSVLRCGARIRATEEAIIQSGAEAALFRHRCAALENEKVERDSREKALRDKILELQNIAVEKEQSIEEWKTRHLASEALLQNERHSVTAARAVVGELEGIVRELRGSLSTEQERCSILAMDNTMLSGAVIEGRASSVRSLPLELAIQSLQQELRESKLKLDKARVRCVELEMRIEKLDSSETTRSTDAIAE